MDTKSLRQKILDLAIRGKLVPQDPNDEPASVLLERIRAEKERLIAEGKIKRPKKNKASSSPSHYGNFVPPFEIPDSWQWVRLEEIYNFIDYRGVTPTKISSGVPLITAKNVKDGYIDYTISEFISSEEYENRKGRGIPQLGDILFTTEAPLGNVALADKEIFSPGQRIITFKEYCTQTVYNHFYLILFLSDYFKQRLFENKTGSGVEGIQAARLKKVYIPFPPYNEQRRIYYAVIKWTYQHELIWKEKIELARLISTTKSKILELAMQGKLVPQDPADEPAAEMLRRVNPKARIICDTPHSWNIPDNWVWTQMGDVFSHNTGKALNNSNREGIEYEYITTSNVYWGHFELDNLKKMSFKASEIDKCKITKGDLLVCEGGDVGRAAIWIYDYPMMIQNHLHRLRPLSMDILPEFYFYALKMFKDKSLIGGKGIALQGFSSNALHKLVVPLPPIREQKSIVIRIKDLWRVLDEIEASLQS